jgi:hypothetical protein
VPEPTASDVEVAIRNLKRYKAPGSDQIPAGWGGILHSEIHKFITVIWSREELPHQWSQLSYLFTKRMIKQTVIIIEAYHCCQVNTKFYPTFFSLG